MSSLVVVHVVTGLIGIACGLAVVVGGFGRRRMGALHAASLAMTGTACATGFAFLPTSGVTSAQLVGFLSVVLLATAVYARYGRGLAGLWGPIYAIAFVDALFLNVLIATTQSFLHLQPLRRLAPTQHSPVYVAVKVTLFVAFTVAAIIAARRAAGGTSNAAGDL